MDPPRRRNPRPLCGLVVAVAVVLSWAFVLYGARVTAQRQLKSGLFAQRLP